MIAKYSVMKIQNLAVNHKSEPVKLNTKNYAESMLLVPFLIYLPIYHAFNSLVLEKFAQVAFQYSKSDYQKISANSSKNCHPRTQLLSNFKLWK